MKKGLRGLGLAVVLVLSSTITSLAGTWEQDREAWRVKENGVYLEKCWYEDSGNWYLLDEYGDMRTGLHMEEEGVFYLLNRETSGVYGSYGRMIVEDGEYEIAGSKFTLTFNQEHNGSYGVITSGLDSITWEQIIDEMQTYPAYIQRRKDASGGVQGSGGLTDRERAIGMY